MPPESRKVIELTVTASTFAKLGFSKAKVFNIFHLYAPEYPTVTAPNGWRIKILLSPSGKIVPVENTVPHIVVMVIGLLLLAPPALSRIVISCPGFTTGRFTVV